MLLNGLLRDVLDQTRCWIYRPDMCAISAAYIVKPSTYSTPGREYDVQALSGCLAVTTVEPSRLSTGPLAIREEA